MQVARLSECGDDAGRDAQMAVGAHAVVDECDGFAALAEEAQEVREDGRRDLEAQVFEESLAVRGCDRRRTKPLLGGVE